MYEIIEMEDVLFSCRYDYDQILDAYLSKYGHKTPIWCSDFQNSYAIVDGNKAIACFHAKNGTISQITISKGLVEPVSHLIFEKAREIFEQEEENTINRILSDIDKLFDDTLISLSKLDKLIEKMKGELECIK